jgi:ATP-binding cassette subfamily C protein
VPSKGDARAHPTKTLWLFCRTVVAVAGWRLAAAIALMATVAVTSGLTIVLMIPLVEAAGVDVQAGRQSSRLFSAVLTVVGLKPSLALALAALVIVTAAQGVLNGLQARLTAAVTHDVACTLRRRVFAHMVGATWEFVSRYRTADHLHTLTGEIDRVGYGARNLLLLGGCGAVTIMYVALAVSISAPMTVVILAAGGVLALVLTGRRRAAWQTGDRASSILGGMYRVLTDALAHLKTIRSYGAESRHVDQFVRAAEDVRDCQVRTAARQADVKLVFDVGVVSILGVVAYLAIRRLAVPPAELFVLFVLFARLAPQLSSLHYHYQSLLAEAPAFAAIIAVDERCKAAAEARADCDEPISFQSEVRLEHVSFAYDGQPVLAGVNVVIPAGRSIAIVGRSGAGKSTIADLVLGLLTPQTGRVLVDGVPLTAARFKAWRDRIGYVPQDPFLFHDTIRANLLWAARQASEEQLWGALRSASAADFVSRLPSGMDTVVGDRGVLLSGGERQRIALARALVRRPSLLIFDEATNSLDSENERVIQRAVEELHGHVSMLLITHRLSTVRRADRIYVLDEGRIVESGSWDDLIVTQGGRFEALSRAQGLEAEIPGIASGPALVGSAR